MSCERIITVCTFVRLVCGDGQCNMMLGKQTPAGRQHSFSSAQVCNMAVLEKLGLLQFNENLGTNTLYEHMLDTIKVKKYTQAILTDGFVTELHGLLCLTRSRHEKVPKNKLSRAQFLHVIGYLVAKMSIEDASAKKFGTGLFKLIPRDASAQLWQAGINFVMKQAGKQRLVGSEATGGGEGSVGGEDGDSGGGVADGDQVRGGADSHPRGEVSEDVRRGEELAAADKDGHSTVSGDTKIGGQGEDSADQGANKGENTHYLDTYIYHIFLHILN